MSILQPGQLSRSARLKVIPILGIWPLRSILREDPDVVLVGEMRDFETISQALTIAETGTSGPGHVAYQLSLSDSGSYH